MWRHFGPRWLAFRLRYAATSRTGGLRRRTPPTRWEDQPFADCLLDKSLADPGAYLHYRRQQAPRFFYASDDSPAYQHLFARWDEGRGEAVELADDIASGTQMFFSRVPFEVGFPPAWDTNHLTGQRAPSDRHWSEIGDFACGDIKLIWEPSRFHSAYALVRAYWRTGDERHAETFWRLVEDWRLGNPPQRGANWKCGQEISLRVMAWCFGLYGFLASPATTAERVVMLASMLARFGERVESNLEYAVSQRNNHGISEGVGLWTLGTLFPEMRVARAWRERGREVLESQARDLIYPDGAFAQHSVNYHRLMLHDYLWALRLGELNGTPFSEELGESLSKATDFLYQIQDGESGRVPCYGHNDGALILPLNNCDYQDFRPVIQATHYLLKRERRFEPGAWDEDLLWLFGPEALTAPVSAPPRRDLKAPAGGYYTLRAENGFMFTRCATFRDRPAQADMLHVDLWWRGQNIAADAGTYSYNAPAPWNNSLAGTDCHNTVTVDGSDQMDRVGKFMWLPWLRGKVNYDLRSVKGMLSYWEGEHDGYRRLKAPVSHKRGVLRLGDDSWLVLDELISSQEHDYRLHWLFPDQPYEWQEWSGRLVLRTPAGAYYVQAGAQGLEPVYSLVRADERSARGWRSPYYMSLEPALSVDLVARARSLLFWTTFGPESCQVAVNETGLALKTVQWEATVDLRRGRGVGQLIGTVQATGALADRLELI